MSHPKHHDFVYGEIVEGVKIILIIKNLIKGVLRVGSVVNLIFAKSGIILFI